MELLSRVRRQAPFSAGAVLAALSMASCGADPAEMDILSAAMPLHLAEHLAVAVVEGSQPPTELPAVLEWNFDRPQPDWKPADPAPEGWKPVSIGRDEDALRLSLVEANRNRRGQLDGSVYVPLPAGTRFEEWSSVLVRARSADPMRMLGLNFNHDEESPFQEDSFPFRHDASMTPILADGAAHTYRLPVADRSGRLLTGPMTHLALWCTTERRVESANFDILSVRLLPREADYATNPIGVRMLGRRRWGDTERVSADRRVLYVHSPARITYRVRVPAGGRLDLGLGVVRPNESVTFRVSAVPLEGSAQTLLERDWSDAERWSRHSCDLSGLAGTTVDLTLEAEAERTGAVALWASPVLSGSRTSDRPNIVFYVIDGGGADYMSVFGYERTTTPNLERIAREGAVFEQAYSNSAWTRPSTASFLTSLHHSVLGGLRNQRNPVPLTAVTMAEHMHRAGYLTAAFTANPNAGRMSDLDRGLDAFREAGVQPTSVSSVELHENFWTWRDDYPAEPFWVHFQPTDVHNDHTPVDPFAGRYIDADRRARFEEWLSAVNEIPEDDDLRIHDAVRTVGADPLEFWTAYRDLHDETMLHQDHRLGELVQRLKATGEWQNTLLVVASDHSVAAGSWDYCLFMQDPPPQHVYHDDMATPILRPGVSRIPMIFVWPGHIAPGQRFTDPVSMIDVLPTLLELADLPQPELAQGRSLAPLLLGRDGWEPEPVVFDEFKVDPETGEYRGRIELLDGRWGASLEINPAPDQPERYRRESPLLLFDLEQDPNCLESLHEEHPDLVAHYFHLLKARYEAHRRLGQRFAPVEGQPMTSEQLEALRALGYVGDGE